MCLLLPVLFLCYLFHFYAAVYLDYLTYSMHYHEWWVIVTWKMTIPMQEPSVGAAAYSSIPDLVLGFDKKTLQAAFNVIIQT